MGEGRFEGVEEGGGCMIVFIHLHFVLWLKLKLNGRIPILCVLELTTIMWHLTFYAFGGGCLL
jgi:hypothetical protein